MDRAALGSCLSLGILIFSAGWVQAEKPAPGSLAGRLGRAGFAIHARFNPWAAKAARARIANQLQPFATTLAAIADGPRSWQWRQRASEFSSPKTLVELAHAEIPGAGDLRFVLRLQGSAFSGGTYYPPDARLAATWTAVGESRQDPGKVWFLPGTADRASSNLERLLAHAGVRDRAVPWSRMIDDSLRSLEALSSQGPSGVQLVPPHLHW